MNVSVDVLVYLRTLDIYGLKIYQSLKKHPSLGNCAHSVEKQRETTSCRILKLIFVKCVTEQFFESIIRVLTLIV